MFFILLFETTHGREQLVKVLKKIVRQLLFLSNHLKYIETTEYWFHSQEKRKTSTRKLQLSADGQNWTRLKRIAKKYNVGPTSFKFMSVQSETSGK